MPYDNLPRVTGTFLESGLKTVSGSSQNEILILGSAISGKTFEKFRISSVSQAEKEFGGKTSLLRGIHEAIGQGADYICAMRVGGKQGKVVITGEAGTLTITTNYRGDEILSRYALILDGDRSYVYDAVDEVWVFDSEEVLTLNYGIVEVDISDDWSASHTLNSVSTPATAILLADLVYSDASPSFDSVVKTAGTDGDNSTQIERYSALATAYHLLDFKDADIVVPMDVYADASVFTGSETYGAFWAGIPTVGSTRDKLGWAWHYLYEGRMYTYFTDTATYFSVAKVAASKTTNTNLVLTAAVTGKGGNANTFQIALGAADDVTITENANGGLDILFTAVTGVTTNSVAAGLINTALDAFTVSTGAVGSDLVTVTGGVTVISLVSAKGNFTSGAGGHVITHTQLTGEAIPSVVSTAFAADDTSGSDTTLRVVNFAHQLASFCHLASSQWKNLLGVMSIARPPGVGRQQLASWVGELPDYSSNGTQKYVDSGDNGNGVLGFKYLAGAYGYRTSRVEGASGNEGLGFGGYILTKGTGLHTSDFPYGILDSDEAVDAGGRPIDIGKYLWISYEWPVHQNSYNNGIAYRGDLSAVRAGRLATLPPQTLPIGQFGRVARVSAPLRIHSTQQNSLAQLRLTGLKLDDTFGITLVSGETAAHPASDYTLVSTIRSVNAVMDGIRRISKPFLGQPHNAIVLASMQQAIDGYLTATKNILHQKAIGKISYTMSDRVVLGRVNVTVRMVPPFSIKEIAVTMSLAADESQL